MENDMLALRRTLVTALIAATASVCALAGDTRRRGGTAAPDFKLQDQKGQWHTLSQYKGKWVVLYFYPKDETPGCTTQACELRDNIFAFRKADAVILGVSADDGRVTQDFAENHSLPFDILADPNKEAIKKYGVLWSPKEGVELASRQTLPDRTRRQDRQALGQGGPEGSLGNGAAEIKAHTPV
jgi:peroxiredoxin Q/BCP